MQSPINLKQWQWLHQPASFELTETSVSIHTTTKTYFWQRTYYGFRVNNAPALVMETDADFSFSVTAEFQYKELYDQCGVLVYHDEENWFKASIEFENASISRLGSVVTNLGYSDWATTDIPTGLQQIHFRLSRRGKDFLIEQRKDGNAYAQMRIFHLHHIPGTIKLGVYACSPVGARFPASFSAFRMEPCIWPTYG